MHRNIRLLQLFNFFLDFRPYTPVAIIYFSQITGSFALGLSVFSVVMVSSAILEIPTGVLSDRVGRKLTLVIGAVASVCSIVFYAMGGSFVVLAVGAVCEGLSRAFFSGNNDALLYDTLKEESKEAEYAEFLGKTSSMFQVGLGISAVIGGLVATKSLVLVMWISVIPQVAGLIVTLFFKEPRIYDKAISTNIFSHLGEAVRGFMRNAKLRMLSLGSILNFGIGETMHQFTPAFLSLLWPVWAVGIARAFNHLFASISFHFAGPVIRKFSALKTLIVGKIASAALWIVAVLFPTQISPALLSITSLTFGTSTVASGALMQEEFTNEQRATMGSLNSLAGSLFFGVFAFFFGVVADALGPRKSLLIGEILALPIILMYWGLFKKNKAILK